MRNRPALKILIPYLAGIILADRFDVNLVFLWLFSVICLLTIFFVYKKRWLSLSSALLFVCFIILGFMRYEIDMIPPRNIDRVVYQDVGVYGTVINSQKERSGGSSILIDAEVFPQHNPYIRMKSKITIRSWTDDLLPERYRQGDTIGLYGRLTQARNARNPGEFDYRKFLQRQGIFGIIYLNDEEIYQLGSGGSVFLRWIGSLRQKIGAVITELSSDYEVESIFRSLILGEGGEVPIDLYRAFQKTGTTHVLVVSGVNFAILAGCGYWLFNAIRKYVLRIGKCKILLEKEIITYIPVFIIIVIYLFVANREFSVFRAFIFITLLILSVIINRDRDIFNILAIAGLIILLFIPGAFWNAGFQLSFVAVASIAYLMPYLDTQLKKTKWFRDIKEKKWHIRGLYWFIQGIGVSITAQLGAVTIIAYTFHTFSPIGFLVNSLIFPLVFIVTPTAFALCFIGLISLPFAKLFSWTINIPIKLLIHIVRWFSDQVDFITLRSFSLAYVFLIAGVIIFLVNLPKIFRKSPLFNIKPEYESYLNLDTIPDIVRYEFSNRGIKLSKNAKLIVKRFGNKWLITDNPSDNWFDKRQAYIAKKGKNHITFYRLNQKPLIYSLALISLFCWAMAIEYDGHVAKITYLDVREADAIFVQSPDRYNILIDGGSYSQRFDCGERIVAPFLRRNGVGKLDLMIATHPDNDHVGGLVYLLDDFIVDRVITGSYGLTSPTYDKFLEKLKWYNINYQDAKPSIVYENKDFKVEVLSDQYQGILKDSESRMNNNSVVTRITYKDASFLFTGDIEKQAEQQLVRTNTDIKADVLKVPHHGSRSSSTYELINAVQPSVAVISVGYKNFFGHPHSSVVRRYEKAGVNIYRTDINGAITIITDGRYGWIKTMID